MRWSIAVVLLAAACGGGGGGSLPPIEQIVEMGLVRPDAPTQLTIILENPFDEKATAEEDTEAGLGGPFSLPPTVLPRELGPKGDTFLPVVFTPPAPGTYDGQLTVRFRSEGGRTQDVNLELSAETETPVFTVVTTAISFPELYVGESSTRIVRVRNESFVTPIVIDMPGTLPGDFTGGLVAPTELTPGAILDIPITYQPQAPGTYDFQLEIEHPLAGSPYRVRVTAQCTTWIPEQVIDFGTVPLSGGQTGWLEFEMPPDGISFSIEAIGPSTAQPGLLGLEGPGGKIYENATSTGAFVWMPGFEGVFCSTLPNSDRSDVQLVPGGGTYRFRLFMFIGSASSLDVRVIVESRPSGIVSSGELPLNVFLAPGLNITDPEGDQRLQDILARADEIFAQSGLSLGDIDYYQLTDATYNDVTEFEFPLLLQESAVATERRVNLFFVQTAFGGGTLGVAGSLPGPAANGTRVSGVMADFDYSSAAAAGHIAAHEIGHYLGLFHTTESDGSHDIIDDTVECPASGTSSACPTVGNDYLMHWQYFSSTLPVITAGQTRVILGHPLLEPPSPTTGLTALALRRTPGPVLVDLPPGYCATCAAHK